MKRFAWLLMLSAPAWCQLSIQYSNPSATTITAGGTASFDLSVSGSNGLNAAAYQWSWNLPTGVTVASIVASSQAAAASKVVACGVSTCMVVGMNANILPDGPIARVTLAFSPSVKTGSMTIGLSQGVAADATGTGLAVLGSTFPLTVTPPVGPCDLDGNGVVNDTDVQLIDAALLAQWNGGAAAPISYDLSGDGIVNVVDRQRIVNAKTGVCRVGI